jgi:23S rRNA pseudouridine1911/1915/1917 synthase
VAGSEHPDGPHRGRRDPDACACLHALHPIQQDHEGRLTASSDPAERPSAALVEDPIERHADTVPSTTGPDEGTVVLTFRVPNELDGQRLDRFLEWRIPRLTRERAREIVEACARDAHDAPRRAWERVRAGETVRLVRERFREPDAPRTFGVLYADPELVVVDKPPGLPVHPSATYHRNTLTALLRERFGEGGPHIAHRLDKETSGIVVCAPPGPFEVRLKKQFEGRTVGKTYLAVVRGVVEPDTLRIDRPMRRALSGLHMCMEVHASGAEAVTELEVVERRTDRTLVRLRPRTGRQHQLRVHMADIGHPILGDKLYGPGAQALFFEVIEHGMSEDARAALGHARHALHAHRIELDHPRTGERVAFESPLPADLVALLDEPPSDARR